LIEGEGGTVQFGDRGGCGAVQCASTGWHDAHAITLAPPFNSSLPHLPEFNKAFNTNSDVNDSPVLLQWRLYL
jgi:hypothetical protein